MEEALTVTGVALLLGISIAVRVYRTAGGHLEIWRPRCVAIYAVTLLAATWSASRAGGEFAIAAVSMVLAIVAIAAITDMQSGLIFDAITVPALVLLILAGVAAHHAALSLYGALAGAALPGCLYLLTRGRGIGLGDVKLGACIGAALGSSAVMYAFGLAFVAGAAVGLLLIVTGRASRKTEIRFAPYLALATACVAAWL